MNLIKKTTLLIFILILQLVSCDLPEDKSHLFNKTRIDQNLYWGLKTRFSFKNERYLPYSNLILKLSIPSHYQFVKKIYTTDANGEVELLLPFGKYDILILSDSEKKWEGSIEAIPLKDFPNLVFPNIPIKLKILSSSIEILNTNFFSSNRIVTDTGQSLCYTDEIPYSEYDCNSAKSKYYPGQDANYNNVPSSIRELEGPIPSIIYKEDYITLDKVSNRIWKTCPYGTESSDCSKGKQEPLDYFSAANYCDSLNQWNESNGYAGEKGWRLPTIQELLDIADLTRIRPSVSTSRLPGITSSIYWSSTITGKQSKVIDFGIGETKKQDIFSKANTLCVIGNYYQPTKLDPLKDNLLLDTNTNLVWEKCLEGQTGKECIGNPQMMSWKEALNHCRSLSIGNRQWRLPNANELRSLWIEPDLFYNQIPSKSFYRSLWTSTSIPNLEEGHNSYTFNFITGDLEAKDKKSSYPARCVSDPIYLDKQNIQPSLPRFKSFSFGNWTGEIEGNNILVSLPYGIDTSNLVAEFETTEGVKVFLNGQIQESGKTTNNFSNPLNYQLKDKYGNGRYFLVIVNKSIPVSDTGIKDCHGKFFVHEKFTCGNSENNNLPRQDGNYIDVPNHPSFEIGTNHLIVKDSLKNIFWKRCLEGLEGKDCKKGELKLMNYSSAKAACDSLNHENGYANLKNWRLPSMYELISIVNYSRYKPSIDSKYFPNTPPNYFWSNTKASNSEHHYWATNFLDGISNSIHPEESTSSITESLFAVRCVSGLEHPKSHLFYDNRNGTVLDSNTGLTWEKCSLGQTIPNCEGNSLRLNWKAALKYCRKLRLAGKKWRLPNVKELQSIIDYNYYGRSLDSTAFQSSKVYYFEYWSSTVLNRFDYDYKAFSIKLDYGKVSSTPKYYTHLVKCVSGGD